MSDDTSHPILSIKNNNLWINDREFQRDQLREAKEYLQQIGSVEALFYPQSEDEEDKLQNIVMEMRDQSQEVIDDDLESFYLN